MTTSYPTKPAFLIEPDFLERKKNELLACLYTQDGPGAAHIFEQIRQTLEPALKAGGNTLAENDEKKLNQVDLILKQFKPLLNHDWSPELLDQVKQLQQLRVKHVRHAGTLIESVSFDSWLKKLDLNPVQQDLLFQNAMTFQLTKGCSNFCRRCNEWALPKVRGHFSFNAIVIILYQIAARNNEGISLYGASDPLDYYDDGKTIVDIAAFAHDKKVKYSLLTKIPKGRKKLMTDLIQMGSNISVSMTRRNKRRINALEKDLGHPLDKQHDLDDLLIPACLDEDFRSVKPSITDGYGTEITPDGAFIIIPTFTSSLHPFGHDKIPVTRNTRFFPEKMTGRNALLIDYFKPLKGFDLYKKRVYLSQLLDCQIESILLDSGHDDLTPPGMRSIKEYFSIFDDKARRQRRKMTRSVVKKLKKKYLAPTSFQLLGQDIKKEYLTQIRAHFNLCKKDTCLEARKLTAAYFLCAIQHYCHHNPVKLEIIRYLVKDEINVFEKSPDHSGKRISDLFSDEKINGFLLFRSLVIKILFSSDHIFHIDDFINETPVAYDPVIDLFVPNHP